MAVLLVLRMKARQGKAAFAVLTGMMYWLSHNSTGRNTNERDSIRELKSPVIKCTCTSLSEVTVAPFLMPPLT